MKIAIATCFNIPEPDVDEGLVLAGFDRRGHQVVLAAWEDPSINWADFDAVVVRSTWNYPENLDSFSEWIKCTSQVTKLLNPAHIMLGNLNKRYLIDMGKRGVPVIDTQWIYPNHANDLREMMTEKSVIKPAVGAGSWDTRVFETNQIEEAISWLRSLESHREFMVQPFLDSVNTVGEQSIVVIGGEPSHRILKHPRLDGQEENVEGPFEVGEYAEIARQIIDPIKDEILYARVDLMMDNEGTWRLSELELVEPSLFLTQNPSALEKLIDEVERMTNERS